MKKRILSMLLLVATIVTALPLVAFPAIAEEQTPPERPIYSEDEYNSYYVLDGLFHASDLFRYNEYWRDDFTFTDRPLSPSETEAFDEVSERSGYYVLVTDVAKGTTTYYSLGSKTPWVGVAVGDRKNPYATQAEAKAAAATAKEVIDAAIAAYNADEANTDKLDAANYTTSVSALLLTPEYITAYNAWNTVHVGANAGVNWYDQFAWTWKDKYSTVLTSWYHNTLNETSTSYVNGATAPLHPTSEGYATVPANLHTSSGLQISNFSATNANFTDVTTTQVVASLGTRRDGTKFIVNNAYMSFAIDPASNGSYVSNLYYSNGSNHTKFYDADGNLLTEKPLSANKVMLPVSETDVLDLTFTYTKATDVANEGPSHWNLREMNSEIFDVYAALYQYDKKNDLATYQKPATTFYFGWSGSCPDAHFYAFRQYTRALSDAEIRQNHLADLMKFYRLDLGYIKQLDEDGLATVALAVEELELDDGFDTVNTAVQTVARRLVEEACPTVAPVILATIVAYGLDIEPVRTFAPYRIPTAYTFLAEGYRACADAEAVQAGYLAALNADMKAMGDAYGTDLGIYNPLYKQEGLVFALDFFATNAHWGLVAPTTASGAGSSAKDGIDILIKQESFLWRCVSKGNATIYADAGKDSVVEVQDGYMAMGAGDDIPIYSIAQATDWAVNGVTEEMVTVTEKMTGTAFYVNDIRMANFSATYYPGDTVKVSNISLRSDNISPFAVDTKNGIFSYTLPAAGVAGTYTYSATLPEMTQDYYQYTYPSDVVQPTSSQMAGESMSTSYFYITHTASVDKDGKTVLTPKTTVTDNGVTKMQYAVWAPIYTTVTEGEVTKRYITGAVERRKYVDEDGVVGGGMGGADSALDGAIGDYWLDPAKGTASASFAMNGKIIYTVKNAQVVNNHGVCGSESRIVWSGSHTHHMYALRYYAGVLTEADMAKNHLADIAKAFRLDMTGLNGLNAEQTAALYAAVAGLDVASSTRLEAQMAVSSVLDKYNEGVREERYAEYLSAGISEKLVEVASFYNLSLDHLTYLPASFLVQTVAALNGLYTTMHISPDFAGAAAVYTAALSADLDADLAKDIGVDEYNSLYVKDGALLLADYLTLNDYWGGTLDLPTAPGDNPSYEFLNGDTYDFTKVENRLLNSYYGQLTRVKDGKTEYFITTGKFSTNSGATRAKFPVEDALTYMYKLAGVKKTDAVTFTDKKHTVKGEDGITYTLTQTTTAPAWILMRQKGDDVWSWEYYKSNAKFSADGGTAKTYATLDDALAAAKAQAGGDSATLLDKETTKRDGYLSADGYIYYVAQRVILQNDAFTQATSDYKTAVNKALNDARTPGGTTIGFGNNLPAITADSWQIGSGNEVRTLAKPRNGYLLMKNESPQQYFSMQNIGNYLTGALQVDLVISAGESAGSGVLFTHRDVALYATATADGLMLEKTSGYAGVEGKSFGTAGYIKDAATLSIFTDRTTPGDTYVIIRHPGGKENNTNSGRLLADGVSWGFGASYEFATKDAALAKAKELAGGDSAKWVASFDEGEGYDGNGYYFIVKPIGTEYSEHRLTVSIDGDALVSDLLLKEWNHNTSKLTTSANNMFGYTMGTIAPYLYAFRYYNRQLTAAEQAQNHFADLAKFYRLDLDLYAKLSEDDRVALNEAMAGLRLGAARADVQAAYLGFFHERGIDVTPYGDILVFNGMSVRVSDGWSVDTPGVRGCFTVNEVALMRLAGKENITFGVEILNKDGVVKATLTFTPTFDEDGSITYVGENKIGDKTGTATLQDGKDAGTKTFAYTVIYNDYTASGGKNYQTAEYYNAEYSYRSFVTVEGVRYERDLVHPSFEGKISAAEVYEYLYTHKDIEDKTGKPFAENKLVKAVMAELGLLTPAE